MTTRLYYTDSGARVFDATVVACDLVEGRAAVVLDRTAFYPTSGGQPFDTGRLGGTAVLEVVDRADGSVVHYTSAPLVPGAPVSGEIDWPRRVDHMQQHTGQHVLSAVFERECGAATTSFHMGGETSTIDLSREVTPGEITVAETEANQVVFDNRPVQVRLVSEEDARRLPLRKESRRRGELRLIEIPGCDLSACGGTHVPQTGAIGLIVVTAWERFKGGTRVTFVCGARAHRSHTMLRDVVLGGTRVLSVTPADMVSCLERLQKEAKDLSRTVRGLHEALAEHRAADLAAAAETIGRYRVVLRAEPTSDAAALKMLAAAVVRGPGLVVVLAGEGELASMIVTRSADVDLDAAALIREATTALGGRGGGRPEAAQAGVPATPARILAVAREAISRR